MAPLPQKTWILAIATAKEVLTPTKGWCAMCAFPKSLNPISLIPKPVALKVDDSI